MIVLPPLVIAALSFIIYLSCKMNLNRFTAALLMAIYIAYVAFTYVQLADEE